MTTSTAIVASQIRDDLNIPEVDVETLVAEIEHHLEDLRRTRTAHPLVTKPTSQLVAEALAAVPATVRHTHASAPACPLRGIWRVLPDKALVLRRPLRGVDHRPVSVAEHLQLTAAVILGCGWAQGRRMRTLGGRRCIEGAQRALWHAGFGDLITAQKAGEHLNAILRSRGERRSYETWNDDRNRTLEEVLELIQTAIAQERGER